ncbi:MAG: alpha/beta hydrolase [Eubacterium sp.]|jgi:pimeloyl-ACP methyl ester carboxylesterase|nr:alpha/beta hydrolase [Eubacterium sp.]
MLDRLVDIGGCEIYMRQMGDKGPVVVLEGGIGERVDYWKAVQTGISRFARTISYERAGNGRSRTSMQPRNIMDMADDLERLMQHTGLLPPFIIVAASYGGFITRAFASKYSAKTSGLLLVEPSHEDFFKEAAKIRSSGDWQAFMNLMNNVLKDPGALEEWRNFDMNGELARNLGFPTEIPITVISSSRYGEIEKILMLLKKDDIEKKIALHGEWAHRYKNIRHIITDRCGHNVAAEKPELVVNEILKLCRLNSGGLI